MPRDCTGLVQAEHHCRDVPRHVKGMCRDAALRVVVFIELKKAANNTDRRASYT